MKTAVLSRRAFLKLATAGVAGVAVADGFIEPNRPVLKSIDVPLARLPEAFDGFRIVQLSDFHYDETFSVVPIRNSIEIVNRLNPDLLVFTGDFITRPFSRSHKSKAIASADPCSKLLFQMEARFGRFASLGNHDCDTDPNQVSEILQSNGIRVLRNSSLPIERDSQRVWISGVESFPELFDVNRALREIPSNESVIMLAHEPDSADEVARYPVDVQLSGHSHGGQIRVPIVGAPFYPPYGRKYPRGFRRVGRLSLYTNVGIGTLGVPIRFDCPPEITLITLRTQRA